MRLHIAILCLFLHLSTVQAQTEKDTTISGYKISYNTLTLYGNPTDLGEHPVLCIGHTAHDTVKTGTWYYFYPSGKLLAKGKYVNGYKKGVWNYYPTQKKPARIKWSKKHLLKTEITFDKNNNPVIKETTGKGLELFNGYPRNSRVLFL